jgi:hypothetical protein
MRCVLATLGVGLSITSAAHAGIVFGNSGLNGGFRWDAAPRTIGGLERSLDGGLRYSLSGGSFQAFRDSFSWTAVPTVPQFQTAVQQAFDAWAAVDPATSFGSQLSFTPDLATAVNSGIVSGVRQGAEIDLFASNLGDPGTRGFSFFNAVGGTVTLTSGTAGYAAAPISGADITLNSNSGAVYSLDLFRRLLTHEIGHAIGLGDVESNINANFIDDNYDSNNAVATLNNSWAGLVDPLNPALSPLAIYNIARVGDPSGVGTAGIDILMESNGLGIAAGNPINSLVPLKNDDFGMRQFLYPVVPEPTCAAVVAGALLVGRRRR